MRSKSFLIASLSLDLAACGGIGADYAEWYDPQTVKSSGPIDVGVVGAPPAVAAAFADALRAHGVQAGNTVAPGTPDANYRVTVAYGPLAKTLARANGMDACKMINGQGDAPLPTSNGVVAGDSVPVVAVLCRQNWFASLAYGDFASGGSSDAAVAQAHASGLIAQVFPAMNWVAYDNANRG